MTDRQHLEVTCGRGHHTHAGPATVAPQAELPWVEASEWRVVGPGLATLIVVLSVRFRLSRARIWESLADWCGVQLSCGTLHQTLHQAAVVPAEPVLHVAVQESGLLHAHQTSWP